VTPEAASRPLSAVGTSTLRVDAVDKVLGRAQYVEDLHGQFPGLLHARVLRSPHAHARILGLETSRAERLPGVRAVVTGADCPRKVSWMTPPILALDEVIWAGQGVAAVAADTVEIAAEAVDLIEAHYEPLPAVIDSEAAAAERPPAVVDRDLGRQPGAPPVTPPAPNVTGRYTLRAGDIEAGFRDADVVVENRFSTSRISHAQLEPAACVARWEPGGGLTLWTNGQGIHVIKALVADLFGLPASRVRVLSPYQGGSFGNRLRYCVEPLAVLLALGTRGTVAVTFMRREMYLASPTGLPVVTRIRTGARRDGTIVAQALDVLVDNGASYACQQDGRAAGSGAVAVYRLPNLCMVTRGVNTHTPWSGAYRGLGSPQVTWAVESQMDILAERLGMSPLGFRLKNVLARGERNAYGETLESTGAARCLQAVAEAIALDQPPAREAGPWRRGKGIAVGGKQNTPRGRSEAQVLVHDDGSLEVRFGADEQGMGAETVMAQIAAEEFRTAVHRIRVVRGDTAATPYDTYSASSFTTYNTGNAVRRACRDALGQICRAAAERLEAAEDDLEVADGHVRVRGTPGPGLPLAALFRPFSMFQDERDPGPRKGTPIVGHGGFAPAPAVPWDRETGRTPRMWNWYQYNACGVEAAVNAETGQVRVLRAVVAADMGFPVNPKLCEAQLEGGLAMAIGTALFEEYRYRDGVMDNPTFADYRVPTVGEVPPRAGVGVRFAPDPLPDGPWGAKGVGEGAVLAVAAAIGNAVYQATGVRIHDLPITAERVLAALQRHAAAVAS
jgi:carbon-monoxide dehydrogenase large subunit